MALQKEIGSLYYICHLDNLQSILEHGLLSHNKVQKIKPKTIYDESIISRRAAIKLNDTKTLWDKEYLTKEFLLLEQ